MVIFISQDIKKINWKFIFCCCIPHGYFCLSSSADKYSEPSHTTTIKQCSKACAAFLSDIEPFSYTVRYVNMLRLRQQIRKILSARCRKLLRKSKKLVNNFGKSLRRQTCMKWKKKLPTTPTLWVRVYYDKHDASAEKIMERYQSFWMMSCSGNRCSLHR